MKTPREILLQRHQNVVPQLDAIREAAVAATAGHGRARTLDVSPATGRRGGLRELLFSLRWHLAGMSAVWLAVAFLNLNTGRPVSQMAAIPPRKIPSPQIILASLRENRREILQLIQPPDSRDAEPQRLIPPPPRSQRRYEILTA